VTLDVRAAEFWEPAKVEAELRRVYDICAGCRRCVGLCPSFKVMFDRIDTPAVDGDVEKLPAADLAEVSTSATSASSATTIVPTRRPTAGRSIFPG